MSFTLSGTITSTTAARYQLSTTLGSFTGNPSIPFVRAFSTSELVFSYSNTLSINTSGTTLDLTNLTDVWGNPISFTTVRHLQIVNKDTTNRLNVGGGSNAVFTELPFDLIGYTGTNASSNGSCLNLTTDIGVDGSHKNLLLIAQAGTILVDIIILGE